MGGFASFPKGAIQVIALFIFNWVFIQTSFASNASVSMNDSSISPVQGGHLHAENESQIQGEALQQQKKSLDGVVHVDAQKLMKLSLLTAEYKQAYQAARQSLLQAIDMNEELTDTLKLQLQIIEKLKAQIHSLEQEISQLKSSKTENIVPIPPPSKEEPPIT